MKGLRSVVVCLVLGSLFVGVQAQVKRNKFGFHAGIHPVQFRNEEGANPELGFHAGMIGNVQLSGNLAFESVLNYSFDRASSEIIGLNSLKQVHNISLEVHLKKYVSKNYSLSAGPYAGKFLKVNENLTGENLDQSREITGMYSPVHLGMIVAAKYESLSGFGLELKYVHGFSNLLELGSVNSCFMQGVYMSVLYDLPRKPHYRWEMR